MSTDIVKIVPKQTIAEFNNLTLYKHTVHVMNLSAYNADSNCALSTVGCYTDFNNIEVNLILKDLFSVTDLLNPSIGLTFTVKSGINDRM